MAYSRDLKDAPPEYNPRWVRTRRLTSSFGQWLGVVDREDGMEPEHGLCNIHILNAVMYKHS